MRRLSHGLVALAAGLALFACASGCSPVRTPEERRQWAASLAEKQGFERLADGQLQDNPLPVAAWLRRGSDPSVVHLYIEGDGLAWESRGRISPDPTPLRPVGLMLAVSDPSPATIFYLGRPCQYQEDFATGCRAYYWTSGRFGEPVIDVMNRRIDALLAEAGRPSRLVLVGYSGGGVVAALVAARRLDVDRLVTIAAPLDHAQWTRAARVSPLLGSLSPMDVLGALRALPQHHLVGDDDTVVPLEATASFDRALFPGGPSRLIVMAGMDHRAWPKFWATLARRYERLDPVAIDASEAPAQAPAER